MQAGNVAGVGSKVKGRFLYIVSRASRAMVLFRRSRDGVKVLVEKRQAGCGGSDDVDVVLVVVEEERKCFAVLMGLECASKGEEGWRGSMQKV